jgi:hypothetical protein
VLRVTDALLINVESRVKKIAGFFIQIQLAKILVSFERSFF